MDSQSHLNTSSHYTVFIRLPFERKDFVDPPPVEWNAAKDEALWKVLSSPTGHDIDWKILAEQFKVSLPFLLQQAAWLYDRQLSQVRAQVRRVGTKSSFRPVSSDSVTARDGRKSPNTRDNYTQDNLASSKANISNSRGPAASQRNVSGGSSKSFLRNVTMNRAVEPKSPATTTVSSTTTPNTVQPKLQESTGSSGLDRSTSNTAETDALPPPLKTRPSFLDAASDLDEEDSTEHASESENSTSTHMHRIGSLRHFDMLSQSRPGMKSYQGMTDEDEEESNLPTFVPLSEEEDDEASEPQSSHISLGHYEDPNATILGSPRRGLAVAAAAAHNRELTGGMTIDTAITSGYSEKQSSTSTSNSNSVSTIPNLSAANSTGSVGVARRVAPLVTPTSPHARYNRERDVMNESLSPRSRTRIIAREETDSTASTASSFSDLDDTSVTRSALEEAYLSGVQNGGIASRVGTISQAFKSKYLSRQ